jgi:uncharacterized protein (DUF362 family)
MDQPWTEDSVARTLINPNYCLTDPPVVTEEKWIEANAKLVQKMGVEPYLATLLSVLRAGSKWHTSWSNLETMNVLPNV